MPVTIEEYLEFDRASELGCEYVCGEIVPIMAGTPWHSLVSGNIAAAIGNRASGNSCRVFSSSLRVCVARETLYLYPDVTVVRGPLEYADEKRETVANPNLVVEVLSPSTRNYDLGEKARMYSRVPSLTELVLIDPAEVWIEHWRRQPNGHWDIEVVQDTYGVLRIESVGCELPVKEIYAGVEFDA